jgi:glycine/D-amino acid oxidase-like deaminating enzyme
MNSSSTTDYIIVGQGLAGSALALQLIKHGRKILVVDKPEENTSSLIAAGLFNPITGYKMSKTWMADLIFPYLQTFYREAETLTGKRYFHNMLLYRPFLSVEEQNEWMGKSADPSFAPYIENIFTGNTIHGINDDFGGLLLKQCGYLDTRNYLSAVKTYIKRYGIFLEEIFNANDLQVFDGGAVRYKEFNAHKIILCQGEKNTSNKWFDWLPVSPLKGETLTIKAGASQERIINRGVYIVPSGGGEFRVGATYNQKDSSRNTTPEARLALAQKLHELVNFSFEITGQEWGMRPTTPDRRPLIGAHPAYPSVVVFNGLGTKGVSLSPYFSENLFRWLEGDADLNKDVDVNRYKSLYSKFTK